MRWLFWMACAAFLVDVYSLWPEPHSTPPPAVADSVLGLVHVTPPRPGDEPEWRRALRDVGAQFVIVADEKREWEIPEQNDGLDVFTELEATTPAGQALTFQVTPSNLSDEALRAHAFRHFLGDASTSGFFLATAHPSDSRAPWNRFDRYPDGVEVVNLESSWHGRYLDSTFDAVQLAGFFWLNEYLGALRFLDVSPKDLAAWDGMNAVTGGHFGVLATDAGSPPGMFGRGELPWANRYERFKLGINIVYPGAPLAGTPAERRRQIYGAIREGRVAFAFPAVFPIAGNDWRLRCGETKFGPGQKTSGPGKDCAFEIVLPERLPFPALVRLMRNGEAAVEKTVRGGITTLPCEKEGAYRLEVWAIPNTLLHLSLARRVPYVFYNPIYVR